MDFGDRALVALASEATRVGVLGQLALRSVVRAAYGIEDAALQGTATPRFSTFSLGGLDPSKDDDKSVSRSAHSQIDALWRGSVRIAASFPKARIAEVSGGRVSLDGLDDAVAAAHGGTLPTGAALESARRAEVASRIAALASTPAAVAPELVDRWLDEAGLPSVAELIEKPGTSAAGELRIAFSPPLGGTAHSLWDFPVAVALLIRDPSLPGMTLRGMIAAARLVQAAMRRAGFEPRQPSEAAGLGKAVAGLLVPEAWFDDPDWPGAGRAQRIETAGAWMAREGVALVAADL